MNNFGVIELASAKTTNAPGWAYVPDRQHHIPPSVAPSTSNRKRARNAASGVTPLSLADANARQETKARREIEILDRDNVRDAQVAIPAKPSGGGGNNSRTAGKKYTPNVRKILQSQKTFANHLDDYVAFQDANPSGSGTPAITSTTAGNTNSTAETTTSRRAAQRQASISTSSRKPSTKREVEAEDVDMPDVSQTETQAQDQQPRSTILTPHPPPPSHPEDANPLFASRLPALPSDDELRALLAAPPLSYLEARGTWPPGPGGEGQQYPVRMFCAVCGYWGRVRCMKCGTRVCALECLETHQEECITRYGL
ncbi:hypothetical protein GGR51DRAFT_515672 [Nemania sp. FL0031]|nr:hypothetical protein GGR51DRAFT_515672 [Nemania sp. FL0031]